MVPYSIPTVNILQTPYGEIHSFTNSKELNVDSATIQSFSLEWAKFSSFSESEIEQIGNDYFDLLPARHQAFIALDMGCGSGRWTSYAAKRMKFVEAIDPSEAVYTAKQLLKEYPNTRVSQASANNIPFPDQSFDMVFCLGVLHHIPDTKSALKCCYNKLKPGGYLLIYLYYSIDSKGLLYRLLFQFVNLGRKIISSLPQTIKSLLCEAIALLIYLPLSRTSLLLEKLSLNQLANLIPLSYYRNLSFHIMRNDALDRFGTPIEKRFSKIEIEELLTESGFTNIQFSAKQPYWHAIATRK